MLNIKNIISVSCLTLLAVLALVFTSRPSVEHAQSEVQELAKVSYPYDINPEDFEVIKSKIKAGESLSTILKPYGLSHVAIDKIARACEPIYSIKNMRAGNPYLVYIKADSTKSISHFIYERTQTDYLAINILGDSISVEAKTKPVTLERRVAQGVISSSLWNCMVENDVPVGLTMEMSDIYAWAIDFFGLQKDDSFKVIYDEKYIDSLRVGYGTIWGMEFNHGGKSYYAVPFNQEGRLTYWDENGNSLRKNLLKAPLRYSRISSKFSYSRLHPILKIRRPHLGVDYAAPMGTPVVAVADGVVTYKGYSGGGGNTLKIKHAANLSSGYLHLKSFAKGVSSGAKVAQGQVIGYVGSTGMSTGPHLDFRLWRGTTPIDPLKAPSSPVEPIKEENMAQFSIVRDRIISELKGELPDSMILTKIDSLSSYYAQAIL